MRDHAVVARGLEKISVLIPTYQRPRTLAATLLSIDRAEPPPVEFEVVVLDNSPSDGRAEAAAPVDGPPATRVIRCREPGKSKALNEGLAATDSDLVVFLDDDVHVEADYFVQLVAGIRRWPEASGYGGRIVAEWPEECALPEPVVRYVASYALASHDYLEDEGPFGARGNPAGPNMAFWRSELPSSSPFDPETGPQPGRYRMGSGEPLFRSIRDRGGTLVYLPRAVVRHRIRQEQLTEKWVLGRSFSYGRSLEHFQLAHQRVSGQAATGRLLGQYLYRLVTQFVMLLKGKDYPRIWARVDRKLIEGILYERFLRSFSKAEASP